MDAGATAVAPAPSARAPDELRLALQAGELRLHYQPIVGLRTGRIRGLEALLRWEHPVGGTLPPDDFLPAVENAPVMRETTQWVLQAACAEVRRWPGLTMSVNVSAADISGPDFADDVAAGLDAAEIQPGRLNIELTETAALQDLPAAVRTLTRLRERGVGVSLDDFGTGYSSLFYLRELPLTEVKIDRVFVSHLEDSQDDAAIVEGIVRLGHVMEMDVVAEGVETAGQADQLKAIDCQWAQGYLFGRPQPPERVDPKKRRSWPTAGHFAVPRHRQQLPLDEIAVGQIQGLLGQGASLHTIAAALNRRGLASPRGTRWTPATVAHAIAALPAVGDEPT